MEKIATAWVDFSDLETGNEHHGTYRSSVKNHSTQNKNCHPTVHKEEINIENIAALPTVDIYFTELCGPIISHALNIEEICVLRNHTRLCDSRRLWKQQNKSQGSGPRFCSQSEI